MDENQFGPNINTTLVQKYVRDGPYPGLGTRWKFFLCFFFVFPCALMLSPLLGIPENAGVM